VDEAGRSASAAIDRKKTLLFGGLGVDATAYRRFVLCLENGTRSSDTEQEHRQAGCDAEGVICSSVDGANGHDGNLGIGEQWSALMNYIRP